MKAKPRKCISMAMKQFDHRIKEEKFKPVLDLTYSPFDPELSIGGAKMAFILNPELDAKYVDLDTEPDNPTFDKDISRNLTSSSLVDGFISSPRKKGYRS